MSKFKVQIRHLLVLGAVILFAVGISIFLILSQLTSRKAAAEHAKQIIRAYALSVVRHSQNFLLPAQKATGLTKRLTESNILSKFSSFDLEFYFFEQLKLSPSVFAIYFATTKGDFIFVKRDQEKNPGGTQTKIITTLDDKRHTILIRRSPTFKMAGKQVSASDEYDPRERAWYKKALDNQGVSLTDPYLSYNADQPGVSFVSRVIRRDGRTEGVVGVYVGISELSNALAELKIGMHGSAFILDQRGDVIAFPEIQKLWYASSKDKKTLRLPHISEIDDPVSRTAYHHLIKQTENLHFKSLQPVSFEFDGDNYHAVFVPFSGRSLSWIVGIYVPENEFLGPIYRNQKFQIYWGLVIGLGGCLVAFVLARRISKPIGDLRNQAIDIAQGKMNIPEPVQSRISEIDELGRSFESMVLELRDQERKNYELQVELQHLSRLSAASDLSTALAHELKQPLTAILNYTQAGQQLVENTSFPESSKIYEMMEKATAQCQRANEIINNLREFIQNRETNLKAENINTIIEEAYRLGLIGASSRRVRIEMELTEDLPLVLIDKIQIQQAVTNLMRNAIQAMEKVEKRILTIMTTQDSDETIKIGVKDTGPGIPKDMQERLFAPFATTKSRGMGLGLYLSQMIVEAHGGRIWTTPNTEGGTTFYISLPIEGPTFDAN